MSGSASSHWRECLNHHKGTLVLIRRADKEDAAAISALVSDLTRQSIVQDLSPGARESLLGSMSPEMISKVIELQYEYHVAELEQELIGVVATRDDSHLYHLFVAKSHQGRGLARQLWETAKRACLARSATEKFTVNSSLNAVEVYRSFGFVGHDVVKDANGVVFVPMTARC